MQPGLRRYEKQPCVLWLRLVFTLTGPLCAPYWAVIKHRSHRPAPNLIENAWVLLCCSDCSGGLTDTSLSTHCDLLLWLDYELYCEIFWSVEPRDFLYICPQGLKLQWTINSLTVNALFSICKHLSVAVNQLDQLETCLSLCINAFQDVKTISCSFSQHKNINDYHYKYILAESLW